MNYFERLVRRALLRPLAGSATVLADPFENVEEWPLAVVAAPPAPRETVLPPFPLPAASDAPEEIQHGEPASLLPSSPEPISQLPLSPLVSHPTSDTPTIDAQPEALSGPRAAAPLVAAATPILPPPPLALADEFMRALGVPLPEPATGTQAWPPEPSLAAPPAPAALAEESRVAARVQLVMPPPPHPPALPPEADGSSPPGATVPAPTAREAERESPRRAPAVIERRQVVMVEKTTTGRAEGASAGAGAPHFGLGQL